ETVSRSAGLDAGGEGRTDESRGRAPRAGGSRERRGQHGREGENLLQIAIPPGDDGPVVRLSAELDPHAAPLLADAVTPYHADENTKQVVLDLEMLQFIDSSGLRVIIASEQALRERGARLVLR